MNLCLDCREAEVPMAGMRCLDCVSVSVAEWKAKQAKRKPKEVTR